MQLAKILKCLKFQTKHEAVYELQSELTNSSYQRKNHKYMVLSEFLSSTNPNYVQVQV